MIFLIVCNIIKNSVLINDVVTVFYLFVFHVIDLLNSFIM